MKIQEFFDKYNNKGIDFDGYYGFQCMDLAHQYATEVVGHDIPAGNAKDMWNYTIDGYDKIDNTPDGVPQKGDIVIWGTAIGVYGHIAIFDHGDSSSFTSFDQNWPLNSLCHFQNHNYTGVLGWFRPQQPANEGTPAQDDWKKVQFDNILIEAHKRSITPDDKSENWGDNKLCLRLFDHIDTQEKNKEDLTKQLHTCQVDLNNAAVGIPSAPQPAPKSFLDKLFYWFR